MPEYRVLLVVPRNDLEMVEDEAMQVGNLFRAKILRGSQADIHGLLAITNETYDIIWFATHGDEKGVYLNDGILTTSEITTVVRSTNAKLVVLNTCSSHSVALTIYDELKIDLVCTLSKVPDRTAFITGTIFARKLAAGLPFRAAYDEAKPGQNALYRYYPERIAIMPPNPQERTPRAVDADLESLAVLVRRIDILVSGSTDYNVEGLIPTVKMLVIKVDELREDFGIMRANQMFNRRLLFAITFISVALLVAVLIMVYQRGFV